MGGVESNVNDHTMDVAKDIHVRGEHVGGSLYCLSVSANRERKRDTWLEI